MSRSWAPGATGEGRARPTLSSASQAVAATTSCSYHARLPRLQRLLPVLSFKLLDHLVPLLAAAPAQAALRSIGDVADIVANHCVTEYLALPAGVIVLAHHALYARVFGDAVPATSLAKLRAIIAHTLVHRLLPFGGFHFAGVMGASATGAGSRVVDRVAANGVGVKVRPQLVEILATAVVRHHVLEVTAVSIHRSLVGILVAVFEILIPINFSLLFSGDMEKLFEILFDVVHLLAQGSVLLQELLRWHGSASPEALACRAIA